MCNNFEFLINKTATYPSKLRNIFMSHASEVSFQWSDNLERHEEQILLLVNQLVSWLRCCVDVRTKCISRDLKKKICIGNHMISSAIWNK